jgi:hypothetical protein
MGTNIDRAVTPIWMPAEIGTTSEGAVARMFSDRDVIVDTTY